MKDIVVVVDDSSVIRNIMTDALKDDYDVLSATNGREALEIINLNIDKNIACLLLDLSMPKYDGFVVLDYFKEFDLFKKVPVYIISGDDTRATVERAFSYDIVDMLNKPFSSYKIKDAVMKAINMKNNS